MQFVFQPLAWGFLLVLLPVLIHLINLLRYRRQRWAAMQFLLESYRRHRRWVWLKQAALLASRMAILAVLVAMLAQWVSGARWLSLLGQSVTHHYVLLDDSLSMGQSGAGGSAYDRGIRSVSAALDRDSRDGSAHLLTIIRFSRAELADNTPAQGRAPNAPAQARAPNAPAQPPAANDAAASAEGSPAANAPAADPAAADAVADVLARSIAGKSEPLFEPLRRAGIVDVDADGLAAARLAQGLIGAAAATEVPRVYYVSDFREKDWEGVAARKAAFQQLATQNAAIELIDCGAAEEENVSLVSLQPDQEVLAAGVPVLLRLAVRNQGLNPLRNVTVRVTAYDFSTPGLDAAFDRFASGAAAELPPVVIERLEPRETAVRAVQVVFPEAGSHVVAASIGEDSLSGDNRVACVLNVARQRDLLVIDDSADRTAANYLRAALEPQGTARTGWALRVESAAFLRDSQSETLDGFSAIWLVDWNTLDPRAVRNLRRYAAAGGGVAVFPGRGWSLADTLRANGQLYVSDASQRPVAGEGSGPLLPMPLRGVEPLPPPTGAPPTLLAEPHPVFAPLLSLAVSPFQFVRFAKLTEVDPSGPVATTAASSSGADSGNADTPQVPRVDAPAPATAFASLDDGSVLLAERPYGRGRIVQSTFALDPAWTNWPTDPSFVVVMLKLAGYLASFQAADPAGEVLDPVRWAMPAQEYLPEVELVLPAAPGQARQSVQLTAKPLANPAASSGAAGGDTLIMGGQKFLVRWDPAASAGEEEAEGRSLHAGVRELWLSSPTSGRTAVNFVANPPATEGNLRRVGESELLDRLSPVPVRYRSAAAMIEQNPFTAASNQQTSLLLLLIILLLAEQALAYSAGYHLPRKASSAAAGVGGAEYKA